MARKQYAGEAAFEWEEAEALLDLPFVRFSGPVRFSLSYEIGEDGRVDVEGTISFTLTGLCSRCLGETSRTFEEEVRAAFLPRPSEEDYSYRNGKVDLGEFVRDSVLIALPGVLNCES